MHEVRIPQDVLDRIIARRGRLHPFERIDGAWWFTERVMSRFLLGDRSHHVVWSGGTPETPTS